MRKPWSRRSPEFASIGLADAATVRLYCACVHRQIIETTAFLEDREASFALIAPSETLADALEHGKVLEKTAAQYPAGHRSAKSIGLAGHHAACLMSAATGKYGRTAASRSKPQARWRSRQDSNLHDAV